MAFSPRFLNRSVDCLYDSFVESKVTEGRRDPLKKLDTLFSGDYNRSAYVVALVISSLLLLAIIIFFGSYKRLSRNKLLKGAVWAAYFLPFYIISNTFGLMQSPPYLNEMHAIWAVLLLLIYGSANSTLYSIQDNQQGKSRTLQEILILYLAYWLYSLHHHIHEFEYPLLLILVLATIKLGARLIIMNSRYSPSLGLKRRTKLLADFMRQEQGMSNETDPVRMRGYKYLVMGEEKAKVTTNGHWDMDHINDRIVTVEKIWDCKNMPLLSDGGDPGGHLKYMCLSFALVKMLVRRFRKYPLYESHLPKTWNFVCDGLLLNDDHERAFQVIEVELSFLYDYFYSLLPVIFSDKKSFFSTIILYLITEILMLGASIWIAIRLMSFPVRRMTYRGFIFGLGDLRICNVFVNWLERCDMNDMQWVNQFCKKPTLDRPTHTHVFGTCVVIGVFVGMQILQLLSVVFSDWTKVWLLCQYVQKPFLQQSKWEGVLGFICHPPFMRSKHWQRKMGQYFLLSSFSYHRAPCCFLYRAFTGTPRRGQKASNSVELSTHVKKAIIHTLLNNGQRLTNGVSSLRKNKVLAELSEECIFKSNTYTILVWHVATSFCVMEHEANCQEKGKDLGKIELNRDVATSLSGYCAYLVAFVPSLLPDPPDDTELLFDATISETRELLKKCRNTEAELYKKLSNMGSGNIENGKTIVEKGVKLGNQLLSKLPDEGRKWKVLADFWAEMILFLAPSDNEMAHAESLANGGEFITHLWVLLTHAGILKRNSSQLDEENPSTVSSSQEEAALASQHME
ncbi:uncharacterized protein LOC131221401 [Magnolia sinica]|uniref:uncharacterized protein LOC131221401 n=1 Tax=Magnolia sinica TaxID=86752 RepID=UPI00265B2C1B|nr:uncharacterized protein LOC131221401 [Magnolia sinica]